MVTMTRDNALLAAFLIEKGQMVPEGWKALQEALDMPIGSPRAQLKSVLDHYLKETDPNWEDSDAKSED
jgi:hypothetical protein